MQIQKNEDPAIISLEKFLSQIGRSRTTGYRWRKKGWIKAINIAGRPYLTREAIAEFLTRAAAGELLESDAKDLIK